MNILFIHGRAQEEYTQEQLLNNWTKALKKSFLNAKKGFPEGISSTLPYYGKELIIQRDLYRKDIEDGKFQMRGPALTAELEHYEKDLLEDLRKNAGITKKEVAAELATDEQNRGFENWGITIAVSKLLDKHLHSFANGCVKKRTEDVVTYLIVPKARQKINSYYLEALTTDPTIIIAHSLGSIIAYDILRSLPKDKYNIQGLITLGSPLGASSVQRQLTPPPAYPNGLKGKWANFYDSRDIVALNPLDNKNFRVEPIITNLQIENTSENRHDIKEYLSNPVIAETIIEMINS